MHAVSGSRRRNVCSIGSGVCYTGVSEVSHSILSMGDISRAHRSHCDDLWQDATTYHDWYKFITMLQDY